jgi:hypothetical protein
MADYPNSDIKTIGFTSKQEVDKSKSESGKTQTRLVGGQRFKIKIAHASLTKSDYMPLDAFIMSKRGRDIAFTITLPDKAVPLGSVTGSPVTNSGRSAGSNGIAIDALVASVTGVFYASDIITFASHTKVYKIVETVSSEAHDAIAKADSSGVLLKADGSGDSLLMTRANQAIVTIFPPLVETVPDNNAVTYSNVEFTVKMTSNIQNYKVAPPNIYEKQVDLIEYIS